MEEAMRLALVEYGRTILAQGCKAGEAIIEKNETRFPDFRKRAHALGIMLRTRELLDGRVAK